MPDVGPVVAGSLLRGTIKEDESLVIGPTTTGKFLPVTITSIRRNRAPCRDVRAGQSASLSLEGVEKDDIRKVSIKVHFFECFCCVRALMTSSSLDFCSLVSTRETRMECYYVAEHFLVAENLVVVIINRVLTQENKFLNVFFYKQLLLINM